MQDCNVQKATAYRGVELSLCTQENETSMKFDKVICTCVEKKAKMAAEISYLKLC